MSLNFDVVGKTSKPLLHEYTWKDCILYALGVGAEPSKELDFLYEAKGPKVLPTFAVVPAFTALITSMGELGANLAKVLHGEQTIRLHRPIPPKGTFHTTATVKNVYDKGKGALAVIETNTYNAQQEPIFDNVFSIFIRGAGDFGGDRGPKVSPPTPPDRAPDIVVNEATYSSQAALYRLSGDFNPLHIDPSMATTVGFTKPILHGLCSYGYAGRAIIQGCCQGQPDRLTSLQARFTGIVYPGDTLTTKIWRPENNSFAGAKALSNIFIVENQKGETVLSNAQAEVSIA